MAGRKRKEVELTRLRPGMPWFERVRVSLDVSRERIAQVTGMTIEEVNELCRSGRFQEVGDDQPAYEALLEYVNERIGMAIAVRNQLQQKLADDMRRKLLHRERIKGNV